ncbi:glycosyltransferase family protein [Desulfoplanes sp.]
MPARPTRVKTQNELGKTRTLPGITNAFKRTGHGKDHIFLGLGPTPEALPDMQGLPDKTWFIECDQFWDQMDQDWHERIPSSFQRIFSKELTPERLSTSTLWTYTPGERLFPSFWGPILARVRLALDPSPRPPQTDVVLLPCSPNGLIAPELARAFERIGVQPVLIPEDITTDQLADLLSRISPTLFVSLNLAGLDSYGSHYHLLRQAGADVMAWMVDNPFHILGKCQGNFWKDIPLGVTDDWFIRPLRDLGGKPFHLPLATDPGFFKPSGQSDNHDTPLVTFVGRTSFPRKQGFFAGTSLDAPLLETARRDIMQGKRRDVAWWIDRLGITNFWPGHAIRNAGLGAEETALAWRTTCLEQAAACTDLTIVGDTAWENHLSHPFTLHPLLDYYGPLSAWYTGAAITLNMTSMLLPHGLTQRNFDVWASGGFLITDTTPGQHIFPEKLCAPVSFRSPHELPPLIRRFTHESQEKTDLRAAWQNEILAHHTYDHRVQKILDILDK